MRITVLSIILALVLSVFGTFSAQAVPANATPVQAPADVIGSYTNPHPMAVQPVLPLASVTLPMGTSCKIGQYFCGKVYNSKYSTTGLTIGRDYPSHTPQRWLGVNRNALTEFGWKDTDMIYSSPSCFVYVNGTIQPRGWVKVRNSLQTIVIWKRCNL